MTIKKIKFFNNFQKEEKWINEMAANGFQLIGYSFCRYTFEKGSPGEYDYCIELLEELPNTEKSKDYLEFMEENGIECVDTYFRWVYFRKKATGEPFEIYTDNESRIKHLQRIVNLIATVGMVNLVIAILNSFISMFNLYVSILNWSVVIILAPFLLAYMRNMRALKRDMELYNK
ncbi:hypothetical protein JOC34_004021 [Virgibacillus halotolerans]|uniref:DUF2812 domain-containing protein n=1 Tax=Virgibacillus halotolerans TaxID=1071053 RepID=UPI00195F51ED|nr:DUF2812 domain-containing protein [Virgibacillus halotolerans]MBM7601593.1 hypothetical protein [Virgibacillus halotolerans]